MATIIVDRLVNVITYAMDTAAAGRVINATSRISAGVVLAGAALTGYAIRAAAAIDESAKQARQLDITTEAYTSLAYAADRSGVSSEKLTAAMRAITMQVAGVAAGSKEAAANFDAIGVSAQKADGSYKTAAELLPEIADGLANMSDEGRRAALRLRLLGEGGAAMAPLLAEGSKGIERLTNRAEALGGVLDSETAAAGERLTDAMTDLRLVAVGLGYRIAREVIPPVTRLAEGMADWFAESDNFLRVGVDRFARLLGVAFRALETPVGRVALGIVGLSAALGVARGASGLIQGIAQINPLLGTLATRMLAVAWPLGLVAAAAGLVYLAIDDIVVTAQGGDSVIRRFADALGVGEETASLFAAAGDLAMAAWGLVPELWRGLTALGGLFASQIRSVAEEVGKMLPPVQWAVDLFDSWTAKLPTLGGIIDGITAAIQRMTDALRAATAYAQGADLANPFQEGMPTAFSFVRTTAEAARADAQGTSVAESLQRSNQAAQRDLFAGGGLQYGPAPGIARFGVAQAQQQIDVAISIAQATDPRRIAIEAARKVEDGVYRAMDALESL